MADTTLIQGQLAYVSMKKELAGDIDGREELMAKSLVVQSYIQAGLSDAQQEAKFVVWQNAILTEYNEGI